jgi:hypothetical protein
MRRRRGFLWASLLFCAAGSWAIGCTGGSDSINGINADASSPDGATGPDGSSQSDTSTTTDTGVSLTIVPPPDPVVTGCAGPTFDITHSQGVGGVAIKGSVTFPTAVPIQRVQLVISPVDAVWGGGSLLVGGTDPTPKTTVTFSLTGLAPDSYYVQALVDLAFDGLAEGDYGGFAKSTLGKAVGPWDAEMIAVEAVAEVCVELGVGTIPCYSAWGEHCTTSAECVGTVCDCGRGSPILTTDTCDLSLDGGTCKAAAGDCSAATCDTPVVRQADCLGR